MTQHPASAPDTHGTELPAAPAIPLMKGQVILLDDLGGGPLETLIAYDGMKRGDKVVPHWRGRNAQGRPFDEAGNELTLPDDSPLRVYISHERLQDIDGGEAFYSYGVIDRSGPTPEERESLRLLCYINRPAGAAVTLPVTHVVQSHDLHLDVNEVPTTGATVVIAPYQAMATGDKVTLQWQGYRSADDSQPISPPYKQVKTVTAAQVGQPLQFLLPKAQLRNANGFHGDLSYTVQYSSQSEVSQARLQRFELQPPVSDLLPAPLIEGFSGGELDPDLFPNGIPVRCPFYTQLLPGDRLWLRWQGSRETLIEHRYVDPSIADSHKLVFVVPADEARRLGNGQVSWQFSRAGAALSSEALPFTVRSPLNLPMPSVEGVSQEAGAPADEGYLRPEAIVSNAGVYITIPEAAQYPGATVALHWQGHDPGGRTVVQRPVSSSQPRRFYVPPQFAAANMGDDESKRFEVFYRASLDGLYQDSPAYKLKIMAPLDQGLPLLECSQAMAGRLSKASVANGATLMLPGWILMAAGQRLTIRGEGTGQAVPWLHTYTIRATDVSTRRVQATVPFAFINALSLNSQLTFTVSVSFDDGASEIDFPALRLQVVA